MEIGVLAVPWPRRSAATARLLEELGFDTVLFPDSQNLAPEVWGQLMLAAQATSRVHLGPGVTNSVTRDAAVTAAAAVALQAESGGRAVLAIGRGDSSVQRIGKREDRVAPFERLPAPLASAARYLREHYDMRDHTRTGVAHTAGIGDDFVDWFAIAGPPDVARERLQQLASLGLDFCHVIPGSTGMPREVAVSSVRRLAQEV